MMFRLPSTIQLLSIGGDGSGLGCGRRRSLLALLGHQLDEGVQLRVDRLDGSLDLYDSCRQTGGG